MAHVPPPSFVIYDGECAFCRRQIDRIRRADPLDQFVFIPSQSSDLLDRFPQLRGQDFGSGMRLVADDGQAFAGADAVHAIARRLPGWRRLAWLYRVPGLRQLARTVYRWIAAHRHRLGAGCENESCRRPPM